MNSFKLIVNEEFNLTENVIYSYEFNESVKYLVSVWFEETLYPKKYNGIS